MSLFTHPCPAQDMTGGKFYRYEPVYPPLSSPGHDWTYLVDSFTEVSLCAHPCLAQDMTGGKFYRGEPVCPPLSSPGNIWWIVLQSFTEVSLCAHPGPAQDMTCGKFYRYEPVYLPLSSSGHDWWKVLQRNFGYWKTSPDHTINSECLFKTDVAKSLTWVLLVLVYGLKRCEPRCCRISDLGVTGSLTWVLLVLVYGLKRCEPSEQTASVMSLFETLLSSNTEGWVMYFKVIALRLGLTRQRAPVFLQGSFLAKLRGSKSTKKVMSHTSWRIIALEYHAVLRCAIKPGPHNHNFMSAYSQTVVDILISKDLDLEHRVVLFLVESLPVPVLFAVYCLSVIRANQLLVLQVDWNFEDQTRPVNQLHGHVYMFLAIFYEELGTLRGSPVKKAIASFLAKHRTLSEIMRSGSERVRLGCVQDPNLSPTTYILTLCRFEKVRKKEEERCA
ncbi:hypothetical protein RRG08_063472 [Elysia crispata]|uniref:Uncharacterized protein n=1 Tax=Elysia crispata TaxID=231223 RepID=A0AAE1DUR6_9GAST|nr:hypothetical protein RRG08_063472 [Elysia crispata]